MIRLKIPVNIKAIRINQGFRTEILNIIPWITLEV